MRKRTVKLWRLHDDGRKVFAGTIEAADPRELVIKWSAFLATAEWAPTSPPTVAVSWAQSRPWRTTAVHWRHEEPEWREGDRKAELRDHGRRAR